jgi:hypothetical protein
MRMITVRNGLDWLSLACIFTWLVSHHWTAFTLRVLRSYD